MKVYKIKVDYVIRAKHACDCEFCDIDRFFDESMAETVTVSATDWDAAVAEALCGLSFDPAQILNPHYELLFSDTIPDGKFFLTGRIFENALYLADGFVVLKKEVAFTIDKPLKEFKNPFPDMQLDYPLGCYVVDGNVCVFEEGCFGIQFVSGLNAVGIAIWSVKNGSDAQAFALAKEGLMVGAVMPMHHEMAQFTRAQMVKASGNKMCQTGTTEKWNESVTA